MRPALIAAALTVMALQVDAGERYVLHNGRSAAGGGRGASGAVAAAPQGAGAGAARKADGGAPAAAEFRFAASGRRTGDGHRSFWGGGRSLGAGVYRVPQRIAADPAGNGGKGEPGGPGGAGDEEAPPAWSKPGALARSEGHRPFQYAETGDAREHTVDAGEIALDPRKASGSNRAPGLRVGPRDTPPPCTPGSSGCSGGGNSIRPNSDPSATAGYAASETPAAGSGGAFDPSF